MHNHTLKRNVIRKLDLLPCPDALYILNSVFALTCPFSEIVVVVLVFMIIIIIILLCCWCQIWYEFLLQWLTSNDIKINMISQEQSTMVAEKTTKIFDKSTSFNLVYFGFSRNNTHPFYEYKKGRLMQDTVVKLWCFKWDIFYKVW